MLLDPDYYRDIADRAWKTAFQFAGATLVVDLGTAWAVDWKTYTGALLLGAAFSITTSFATTGIGPKGKVSIFKSKKL